MSETSKGMTPETSIQIKILSSASYWQDDMGDKSKIDAIFLPTTHSNWKWLGKIYIFWQIHFEFYQIPSQNSQFL